MSLAELIVVLSATAALGALAVRGAASGAELQAEIRSLEALREAMQSYYRRHCDEEELPPGAVREFDAPQALLGARPRLAPGLRDGRWNIRLFYGAAEYRGAAVGRVELLRAPKYARRNRALANHFGAELTAEGALRWHLPLIQGMRPLSVGAPALFRRYFDNAVRERSFCRAG